MGGRRPVVIVGGGTAGSVVAAHLAAATTREIIVIEPGGVSVHDDESRFMDLSKSADMIESVPVCNVAGGSLSHYSQARAMGGGSAVNGLLLTGDEPDYVRGLTRMADESDTGRMGRALLARGGRPSRLWWNGGRWNPGRALAHLVDEGRVRWINLPVIGLSQSMGSVTVSVATEEVDTDCVVMTAGAIRTPEILLRSGLGAVNGEIGQGLQNHPTITVAFEFETVEQAPFDAAVVREFTTASGGEALMVAYERASWTEPDLGLLSVSLMNPSSAGRVKVDDGALLVEFDMLATEFDTRAMREAVDDLLIVASSKEFADMSLAVHADVHGTSVEDIAVLPDADRDRWIAETLQPVSHATSSCHRAVDPEGRLTRVSSVWVADASILPRVPSCTPAAPVTMEALRVARALGREL